jgi:hypothetical protein
MRFGSVNKEIGRHRWTICALIFAATTINYLNLQILSLTIFEKMSILQGLPKHPLPPPPNPQNHQFLLCLQTGQW